jgi:hypothetical protein
MRSLNVAQPISRADGGTGGVSGSQFGCGGFDAPFATSFVGRGACSTFADYGPRSSLARPGPLDHISVEAYEVPGRIAEPVALRDHACVFPWCTRPARRLRPDQHGCDCDHVVPHGRGGATCTCQLAPLCRRHHRLKTHGGWTYTTLEPGTYLWRSPHGYQYLRDHTGTLDVSHDRHSPAPPPDE